MFLFYEYTHRKILQFFIGICKHNNYTKIISRDGLDSQKESILLFCMGIMGPLELYCLSGFFATLY